VEKCNDDSWFMLTQHPDFRAAAFQTAAGVLRGAVSTILVRLRRYKYFAPMVLRQKPDNLDNRTTLTTGQH
jgi:hypothetical protein